MQSYARPGRPANSRVFRSPIELAVCLTCCGAPSILACGTFWASIEGPHVLRRFGLFRRQLSAGRRSTVAGIALAGYLAAIGGFPLPVPHAAKSDGQPFPCQHHGCGCRDADHCWNSCCCFTTQQRLAWAREHRIELPSHLQALLAARLNPPRACCAHGYQAQGADRQAKPASSPGVELVWSNLLRQCRGLDTMWIGSGAVTPPPAATTWTYDWQPREWLSTIVANREPIAFEPAVPPPRA
jgi:hypothetical protein